MVNRASFGGWWRLGALWVALVTAPTTWADPVSAVEVLRAGGCGGIMPAAPPLRHTALLDRAAAEWATGHSLPSSSESSGYRGDSTAGVHIRGPDSAALQLLRGSACRIVAAPRMRDIGIYRRGLDSWIVVASFYRAVPEVRASQPAGPATGTWVPPRSAPVPPVASVPRPSPAPTPVHTPPPAPKTAPVATFSPALASRALQLINDVRASGTHCGDELFGPAPPVSLSGTLGDVAHGHAIDMAEKNYFEHVDPAGQSPADRVRAVGYKEKLVGENIAYGPKSVEEVVQGWLDSPGHCENIMDPRFAEMGIGLAQGHAKHGLYWVQVLAEPRV
jgi:uncharacterized protein YkwD